MHQTLLYLRTQLDHVGDRLVQNLEGKEPVVKAKQVPNKRMDPQAVHRNYGHQLLWYKIQETVEVLDCGKRSKSLGSICDVGSAWTGRDVTNS